MFILLLILIFLVMNFILGLKIFIYLKEKSRKLFDIQTQLDNLDFALRGLMTDVSDNLDIFVSFLETLDDSEVEED